MSQPGPARRLVTVPSAQLIVFACAGALLFVGALSYFLYAYLVRFGRPAAPGPIVQPVLVDLGLFSAFALHHSLLARPRLKARLHRAVPVTLERSFYTWVASALLIATCWWWQPVPGVLYVLPAWATWIGVGLQAAGIVLTFLGSKAIDVLDLAGVRPALLARSGKRPAHPPLMTTGVYAVVRHPLYFGWALLVFGAPTMTLTRAVFGVISTAYLAIAIPWEERSLIETFGAGYRDYQQRVRWRMLPGLY